jgi:hypothetical protein
MPSWRSKLVPAAILPRTISGEARPRSAAYKEVFSSFAAKEEQ